MAGAEHREERKSGWEVVWGTDPAELYPVGNGSCCRNSSRQVTWSNLLTEPVAMLQVSCRGTREAGTASC